MRVRFALQFDHWYHCPYRSLSMEMTMQNQAAPRNGYAPVGNVPQWGESLSPDGILTAEFEYIAQTAFQANEDRARVTNFYLITLAGFVAAILGAPFENLSFPQIYYAFAVLFVVLAVASTLTLLQLARLRQAWFDSLCAMNQLKAFYVARFPNLQLEDAFAWSSTTLPARFKPWSLGFLLAIQTAVLGAMSLGAATVFIGLAQDQWWWGAAAGAVVASLLLQIWLYYWLLRN